MNRNLSVFNFIGIKSSNFDKNRQIFISGCAKVNRNVPIETRHFLFTFEIHQTAGPRELFFLNVIEIKLYVLDLCNGSLFDSSRSIQGPRAATEQKFLASYLFSNHLPLNSNSKYFIKVLESLVKVSSL